MPLISADAFTHTAQAIQLALAPVFLLTGIAALLGVMTNRLARIIDRARHFEQRWAGLSDAERDRAWVELRSLERRRRLTSLAIGTGTFAALMVCCVVATLFLEELLGSPLRGVAGVLFFVAMLSLIVGLSAFLREVHLATQTIRFPFHTRR